MPEMLGNIGAFFSSGTGRGILDLAKIASAGSGLVGNIMNERMRSQELNKLRSAEATLADPTKLSAEVRAATQPLSEGLVQNVSEAVSGNLAERGLSQAPGIQAAELATAVAPYQQQNQQTALQLVLTRLGLPLDYARTILGNLPQNTNLAPLLALLAQRNAPGGEGYNVGPLLADIPLTSGAPATPPILPPEGGGGFANTGDFNLPADIFA